MSYDMKSWRRTATDRSPLGHVQTRHCASSHLPLSDTDGSSYVFQTHILAKMSTKLEEEPAALIAEESESEENGGASEGVVANPSGSLFLVLSTELLLIVFQYIGIDDKKAYIRLAISGDEYLAHFIYTECLYLWRQLDLSKFPGMTGYSAKLTARTNQCSVCYSNFRVG